MFVVLPNSSPAVRERCHSVAVPTCFAAGRLRQYLLRVALAQFAVRSVAAYLSRKAVSLFEYLKELSDSPMFPSGLAVWDPMFPVFQDRLVEEVH